MGKHLFEIPEYDGMGIYAIIDENDKMYIGSSKNIKSRLSQHRNALAGGYGNKKLLEALEKGLTFRCEILEKVPFGHDTYHLREREKYYSEKYDSFQSGYNVDPIQHYKRPKNPPLSGWAGALHKKLSTPIFRAEKPMREKKPRFHIAIYGRVEKYKAAAADAGLSMAQFFVTAADEKIERDGLKTE